MTTDVLSYLQSRVQGTLRRAGGDEVHIPCFFHGEDPQDRGRLYVNVDPSAEIPGLFMCHVCGEKGSLVTIKKFFGDKEETPVEDHSQERYEILQNAAAFYHDALADNEEALGWLRHARGLSVETIIEHQIGWAAGNVLFQHLRKAGFETKLLLETGLVVERGSVVVDALVDMVTIPYHVAGNVALIRGRTFPYKGDGFPEIIDGPKYKTPSNQGTRLFNTAAVWGAEEIVVCEGEFDALVCKQMGFNAVGVPGANTWQDSWDGYLAGAKRVHLLYDNDEAGNKGAVKLVEKFGPKIRRVEMPLAGEGEKKNDPTEWIVGKGHTVEEFKALLVEANKSGLLLTPAQAREEFAAVQGVSGLKFGIELLDIMIEPGLLPAQVMVVLAKAGSGKTLFLLNVMERMTHVPGQEKLNFLFISLEQTRGEWFDRARRIHRFYNLHQTDSEVEDFWATRIRLTDKNRMTEVELNSVLDDYVYQMGRKPDLVCVDYLGYWAQSFKGERYERVSDAVMSLKAVAKEWFIPFITPHQVSRNTRYGEEPDADAARDAGVIEETADFLLLLWTQDHILGRSESEKTGVVNCRIGKSRHGGRGTKIEFQFAPVSLTLVPIGDQRWVGQARDELHYEHLKDRWGTVLRRHRGELPQGALATAIPDAEQMEMNV